MKPARFLRFRLRALLALVTVVSLTMGWYVVNARQYAAEIAAAKAWNGNPNDFTVLVRQDGVGTFCPSGVSVFARTRWQGPMWLRPLFTAVGPPLLDRISVILVESKNFNDDEIPKFASFPQLTLVILVRTQITSAGREHLREMCPNVRVVCILPPDPSALQFDSINLPNSISPPLPSRVFVDEPNGVTREIDSATLAALLSEH